MPVQDQFFQEYFRDFLGKSRYDRSRSLDTSARIGQVFPVMIEEMIPGDHVHCRISQITNFLPLISPVQGIMQVRFETFFAPNQLLMNREKWEKFISDPLTLNNSNKVDRLQVYPLCNNDMPFEGFDILNRVAPLFPVYKFYRSFNQGDYANTWFVYPTKNSVFENCFSWSDFIDKIKDPGKLDGIDIKDTFTRFRYFEDGDNPFFGHMYAGVCSENLDLSALPFISNSMISDAINERFTRCDISCNSFFDYIGLNHTSLRMHTIRESIENEIASLRSINSPVPDILVRAIYDADNVEIGVDGLLPVSAIYSVLDSPQLLYEYLANINILGYKDETAGEYSVDMTNLLVLLGNVQAEFWYRGTEEEDVNFYRLLSGNNWRNMTENEYRTMFTAISPYTNRFASYTTILDQAKTLVPVISTLFNTRPFEDGDGSFWYSIGDPFTDDWQIDFSARQAIKITFERLYLLSVALRGYTGIYMPLWLAYMSKYKYFLDDYNSFPSYQSFNDNSLILSIYEDGQWYPGQVDIYNSYVSSLCNILYRLCFDVRQEYLALPFRLYPRIYNDWYRIPDIDQERSIREGDEYFEGSAYSDYTLFSRAYARDKFVTAFTNPTAKIVTLGSVNVSNLLDKINITEDGVLHVKTALDGTYPVVRSNSINSSTNLAALAGYNTDFDPSASLSERNVHYVSGIKLVSSEVGAQVGGFTIEELRVAVRLQNMADYLNKFSGDYVDYMRSVFTTVPSDASLRRSTIVHSYSDYVAVGDIVTQTNAEDGQTPAERYGIAKSFGKSPDFDYSTREHGYLITLCSVEPFVGYNQGVSPLFKRFDALDFYTPNMCTPQLIPIKRYELYNELINYDHGFTNDNIFGYNEKDLDYKVAYNTSTGSVRNKLRVYSLIRDLNASVDHIGAPFQRIDSRDYDYLFNMTGKDYNSQFIMNIHFEIDKDSVVNDEDSEPVQGTGLL